jgi:hypothetical protein
VEVIDTLLMECRVRIRGPPHRYDLPGDDNGERSDECSPAWCGCGGTVYTAVFKTAVLARELWVRIPPSALQTVVTKKRKVKRSVVQNCVSSARIRVIAEAVAPESPRCSAKSIPEQPETARGHLPQSIGRAFASTLDQFDRPSREKKANKHEQEAADRDCRL